MKCIACEKDSPYKERTGQRCPHCHAPFAFEPKRGDRFTDMAFANAVRSVSGEGTLRFFVDHVYYSVCRRLYKQSRRHVRNGSGVGAFLVTGAIAFGAHESAIESWGAGISIAAVVVTFLAGWWALVRAFPGSPLCALERNEFDDYWRRFTDAHGVPEGLIDPDAPPVAAPDPALTEELQSYSFERAIVCEKPAIANLLLANDFHFEHACAILAEGGHPAESFETVLGMLRDNPGLQVFVLHDASVWGCRLARRMRRDPEWFHGRELHIEEVGLLPRHEGLVRGSFLPIRRGSEAQTEKLEQLSAKERRWLEKYWVELLALRPEALLKRTFAAISPDAGGDHFG